MFLLFNAIPRYEPFLEKENARLYNVFEEFGADFFDKSIATWNVLGCMNDDRKAMEEIAKVTRTKFFFSCLAKGTLSERMKYYENLKLKRIEKVEKIQHLRKLVKEIDGLFNGLKKELPKTRTRIQTKVTKKKTNHSNVHEQFSNPPGDTRQHILL